MKKLIQAAKSGRECAYVPYSNFKVGAAVLTKNGKIYTGCNVENASYGLSNCAERTAIFKAVSEGHQELTAIAIVADTVKPVAPCGACRQVMSEFGISKVIMSNLQEEEYIVTLEELLPYSFEKNICQEKRIMEANKDHKSGFVSVIGRPNVGKSTLINSLIGQKVVIMSDKPQTTRNKIMCVLTLDDAQILFIDTPGIHKPKHKLGEYMLKAAENTLREVDVIFFVVDATEDIGGGERYILELLSLVKTPVILVVNKIDKIEKTKLLPIIQKYSACYEFVGVVPISAMEHTNLDGLITEVKKYLEPGPQYYPEDMITDQPERLVIAEMIREKVLHATRDEIPHSIAVDIEEITTRANEDLYIRAVVYVERESQKGIVIGAKGQLLKEVGKLARIDIENLLGSKIFLDLWVKVKKDWRNKEGSLRSFGYE